MKYSIIIPAYNEAKWITKTVTAVFEQTYKDFELIVVDNNCTDDTVKIVETFMASDRQIRIVKCSTPGILYARNAGLAVARGEIIVQLDADNITKKDWLANATKHFQNKNLVAVAGFYDYYDANIFFRYGSLIVEYLTLPIGNWYVQKRTFGAFMIGGNAFIKKWVLDDMHGYDTSHTFCSEDLVTAREVAKRGYVKYCTDLTVKSSARRHKTLGYNYVQKQYNKGTKAVLLGKPIPRQDEETQHPR